MRTFVFAKRNVKEIVRDPLSALFCIAFPLLLLIVFQIMNGYVPDEVTTFNLSSLTPGICVFAYSFVMLFTAQLVAKDRTTAFLNRLYTSEMKMYEYVFGYALPMIVVAVFQTIVTYFTAFIISLINGDSFSLIGALTSFIGYLPVILLFISFGIVFGSMFSEKAAPGISSSVISASAFLSGAWMPLETMGGFCTFCKCLPFYPAVTVGRTLFSRVEVSFDNLWLSLLTVLLYTATLIVIGMITFKVKTTSDNK